MESKDIEHYILDAITGKPMEFTAGDKTFFLYPLTLGKVYVLKTLMERLGLNTENLSLNAPLETLRLARTRRKQCLELIACHTMKDKSDLFDSTLFQERVEELDFVMEEEDVAVLLSLVLTSDKTEEIMKGTGINTERDRLRRVTDVKEREDKSSFSFGGITVFGSLLDAACERYGWTKEYVVWGIDYASLRLMLADKVTTVYLTDKERKKLSPSVLHGDKDTIKATKETMEQIKRMDWR